MNPTVFFQLLDSDDKQKSLEDAVATLRNGHARGAVIHIVEPAAFALVPGSPLAYWVSDSVRALFRTLPKFGSEGRTVKQGLATADDFRFLRAWWEVPSQERFNASGLDAREAADIQRSCKARSCAGVRWFSLAKGGDFLPFYADIHLVVNWAMDGQEMKAWADPLYGNSGWSRNLRSVDCYFQPGYTYPLRTSRLCPQIMPSGTIISVRGSGIYGDTTGAFLALLASRPFDYLIKMMLGWASRPQFDMGDICATPIPVISGPDGKKLAELAMCCVAHKRQRETASEQTHVFIRPALAPDIGANLVDAENVLRSRQAADDLRVAHVWAEIDDIAFRLYGITDQDRTIIEASATGNSSLDPDPVGAAVESSAFDESDLTESIQQERSPTAELLSYALGVAFGRWDIRYATGDQAIAELPDPFAPSPVCPPGQLQNVHGLPARPEDVPNAYPVRVPWDGILVDEANHPLDIVRGVRNVLDILWNERAEEIENETCEILGVKSLREYFRRPVNFFADHLKRYSKSRRQAPIYWPFSTSSGSYTLWIYYHRLTDQSLYACANIIERKLGDLDKDIPRLRDEKRTKDLQAAVALQTELEDFKQELFAWAPRWKPNLNDGVFITACPLWKLFRLPKWRKDLEGCWKELERGDYDWAHLAYNLWPDRVREKCKGDRSLAIAHELEDICEVEPPKVKKSRKGRGRKSDLDRQTDLGATEDAEELEP